LASDLVERRKYYDIGYVLRNVLAYYLPFSDRAAEWIRRLRRQLL